MDKAGGDDSSLLFPSEGAGSSSSTDHEGGSVTRAVANSGEQFEEPPTMFGQEAEDREVDHRGGAMRGGRASPSDVTFNDGEAVTLLGEGVSVAEPSQHREMDNLILDGPGDGRGGSSGSDLTVALDRVLEAAGVGRFTYTLLALCGLANAADAVEILAISFVITTTAECDLWLTDTRKGWLTATLFIGMMVGGLFWGSASDLYGRKRVLATALAVNAIFGMASAFVSSFAVFLSFRLLSGIGIGGSIPILFTYCSEFLPASKRGMLLTIVASFWMVGAMAVAGTAWAVVSPRSCPRPLDGDTLEQTCAKERALHCGMAWDDVPTWRVFLALSAVPAVVATIWLYFSPESARWYVVNGKPAKAARVLRRLLHGNGVRDVGDLLHPFLRPVIDDRAAEPSCKLLAEGRGKHISSSTSSTAQVHRVSTFARVSYFAQVSTFAPKSQPLPASHALRAQVSSRTHKSHNSPMLAAYFARVFMSHRFARTSLKLLR
eukprot:m.63256 g.63256  ORF g.63256 m.63256 type:complete len:491 (-) comp13437_c0_seq2:1066-2538(-)